MRSILTLALLGLLVPVTAVVVRADDQPGGAASAQDRAAIERLVRDLGADDFRTREGASRDLARFGEKARAALEKAAKESESPEVHWRAEQLLRRLEGVGEKPLDSETPAPKAAPEPQPGAAPAPGSFDEMFERMRKQMERLWERPGRGGMLDPFARPTRVEAPGLVLERGAMGRVTLRVTREKDGRRVEDVFTGFSLADILARQPELGSLPGMEELKRRDAESSWPGADEFRKLFENWPHVRVQPLPGQAGQGSFSFSSSQGVEIQQDANGVTVRLRERGEDGQETVREFKGQTLEDIKREHPEIAGKLGGVDLHVRISPPDFFWPGRERRRLDPLTSPQAPAPRALEGRVRFGLGLDPVDEALASHIGLEAGHGALVGNVLPGTQAEEMGFLRNDVIVSVNGQEVDPRSAGEALRAAAAARGKLEVVIIRRGERTTLTRD